MAYTNYAPKTPRDKTDEVIQNAPAAVISLNSNAGVPVTSSVISLTDRTTMLEMTAIGGSIAIKWGVSSVVASGAGANFDNIITNNTTRQFVVPVSVIGVQSVAGANVANGLYNAVSVIQATATSASVFTSQI